MLLLPHQGGVEFHHHENSVVKVQLGLLPGSTLPAVPRHICLFRLNESHDLLETSTLPAKQPDLGRVPTGWVKPDLLETLLYWTQLERAYKPYRLG